MKAVITSVQAEEATTVAVLLQEAQLPVSDLPAGLPHFFKATLDNRLVGTVGLEIYEKWGLLRSLAVLEGYRNQSVGTLLYETVVEYARQQQVEELYLLTTTAADYFARQGFTQTDRSLVPAAIQQTHQFQGTCPSSATVMKLRLGFDSSSTREGFA